MSRGKGDAEAKEYITPLIKIDHFARWSFLLYINCIHIHNLSCYNVCLPQFNGLFPIHVNEIASTVDDQNKFSFIKTKGKPITCIKGKTIEYRV